MWLGLWSRMKRLKAVLGLAFVRRLCLRMRDETLLAFQQRVRVRSAGSVTYQSIQNVSMIAVDTKTEILRACSNIDGGIVQAFVVHMNVGCCIVGDAK